MLVTVWGIITSTESQAVASWLIFAAITIFTRKIDPHTLKMTTGMTEIKNEVSAMDTRVKVMETIINTDVHGRPGEKRVWRKHEE